MADGTEHTGAGGTADASGPAEFRIFLNYRREDSSGHAGRLYDSLRHGDGPRFGKEQIFMDIDTLAPGANFRRVIEEAVGSCDVFIAVIGRQWLRVVDSNGRRRLDNARDFVRLEIEAALARDIPVVPALVQGTEMPGEEELPEGFHAFLDRNAIELSDARWPYDVGRLIAWLKTIEKERVGREQAERERSEELERERAKEERLEHERLEKEAAEQAALERHERERQEREAAERAERERRERDAAAKAEAAEREKRDALERERAEAAERETAEREAAARRQREEEERGQREAIDHAERMRAAAAALRRPGSRLSRDLPTTPISAQPAISHREIVDGLVAKGWDYYESDRYDEAIASFQAALELDPRSVAALEGRGSAYNQTDRYEEALASFAGALELDPESTAALEGHGWASLKAGRWEDALASFEHLLEFDPGSVSALVGKGWGYTETGRSDEALASFDKALELDPNSALAQDGRASAQGG